MDCPECGHEMPKSNVCPLCHPEEWEAQHRAYMRKLALVLGAFTFLACIGIGISMMGVIQGLGLGLICAAVFMAATLLSSRSK